MPDNVQPRPLRVLIVDDSPADADSISAELGAAGYKVDARRAETAAEMRAALADGNWDLVLAEHVLASFAADEALLLLQEMGQDLPLIIVSATIDQESATAAVKAGARDYVMKHDLSRLAPAAERELRDAVTRAEQKRAEATLRESESRFRAIVSNMPGVAFLLQHEPDGEPRFLYASEGSHAMLGVDAQRLLADAAAFFSLIAQEDRAALDRCLEASRRQLAPAHWEGRIVLSQRHETKWISLRATARLAESGVVQWDGIMLNMTHIKLAGFEVQRSREQLAELASYLEQVKERERARIAREIHDDLGGTLTAVRIDLEWLRNRLPAASADLHGKLNKLDEMINLAIETGTRIASDLRPGILDLGIVAAIEWQLREFQNRTGIKTEIAPTRQEISIAPETSVAVFRILQEALTNIAKHASASLVRVGYGERDGWLHFEVTDNGRGIAASDRQKTKSFGIRGMVERARDLGGTMAIERLPTRGTRLVLRIPASREGATVPRVI